MSLKQLLFVQPAFPTPNKSINHSNFLPIGLLKLITYYRSIGQYIDETQLVHGEVDEINFYPKKIFITTLFTYWLKYVEKSILFYRKKFPEAEIIVGGILATLLPEKIKEIDSKITIEKGILFEVEKIAYENGAAYDVVDQYGVDYQIVHAMRGCHRKCKFCGTWRLEQRHDYSLEQVINYIDRNAEIGTNKRSKLIFYDNNFLTYSHIVDLLKILAKKHIKGIPVTCESQSGFDGRVMLEKPYLAKMLKDARFKRPKIAWDNSLLDYDSIKKQVELLVNAGYKNNEISVFMLYNYDYPFEVMMEKLKKCWDLKVQISDCRFRPLDQTFNEYDPQKWRKGQSEKDYYIHKKSGWDDAKIRLFRKLVRQQNIMVRQGWIPEQFEQWKANMPIENCMKVSELNWPYYKIEEHQFIRKTANNL